MPTTCKESTVGDTAVNETEFWFSWRLHLHKVSKSHVGGQDTVCRLRRRIKIDQELEVTNQTSEVVSQRVKQNEKQGLALKIGHKEANAGVFREMIQEVFYYWVLLRYIINFSFFPLCHSHLLTNML